MLKKPRSDLTEKKQRLLNIQGVDMWLLICKGHTEMQILTPN